MENKNKSEMSNQPRRIVFVTVPPIAEIDLIGALSVFQDANFIAQANRQVPPYQIEIVTVQNDLTVTGDCGLTMIVEKHLPDVEFPIDTLLVAGGSGSYNVQTESLITDWLRQNFGHIRRICSVCTGAFVLAAAGLLDNRGATTHWKACRELQNKYPAIQVESNPIFVRDGNIYTSAGVTAGMDLALELIEKDLGNEISLEIARNLVMFLRRPGGQAQFSTTLAAQAPESQSLKNLQFWIAENLNQPLDIPQLAGKAAMSERNFARLFVKEFGITPARYVLGQRIEAAKRELEQTPRRQNEIAVKCGFKTAGNMRRIFLREVGVIPKDYRAHFSR